jgi:hypothetical protein
VLPTMSWPPPRPARDRVPHRPWDPKHPVERNLVNEHQRLVYVVVDEVIEGWIGLSLALWPHADRRGRLRFVDAGGPVAVGSSYESVYRFLASNNAAPRPPGIGTTFAARVKEKTAREIAERLKERAGHGEVRVHDLGMYLERPADLTEQGRLLAKLACYAAMLSTLPSAIEEQWNLVDEKTP